MTPSDTPSIKAKSWLLHQGLEFQEINLLRNPKPLKKALIEIVLY
jgi:arsenate reductase-like glutaredoxin family protein